MTNKMTQDEHKALNVLLQAEIGRLYRESGHSPSPQKLVNEEKIITEASYGPFNAFDKAVKAHIEHYLLPLIDSMLDRVSEIRAENRLPFELEDRILADTLHEVARKEWEAAARNAYVVSTLHVIHNTGYLAEYKARELGEMLEKYLTRRPSDVMEVISEKIAKAVGEANLKIRMMNRLDARNVKKEVMTPHPAWRLAPVIIVPLLGLLGFLVLPVFAAALWLLLTIFLTPLAVAGLVVESIEGKDFKEMYLEGLKMLPLIQKVVDVDLSKERKAEQDSGGDA